MTDRKLRIGMAGCGYFGRIQLEAWRRMPDVEVVASCDPDVARAREFAPRAFANTEKMLDEGGLDILDIATRPDAHRSLVELAAAYRIPVIVQKPLAPNLEEALAIEQCVDESGSPAMVHENWRWQPWYRVVKQQLDAGAIGPPTSYRFEMRQADGLGPAPYPNQPYFREMPRLLIFETLVHHIDTARFLFGEIASVFASISRRNPIIAGEDAAVLVIRHTSGVTGVIDGNRYVNPDPPGPAMGESLFEGESGRLRVNAAGVVFSGEREVWRPDRLVGYKGDSVYATQRHFLDCLQAGQSFETSIPNYMNTFRAVEAAYESANRAQVVPLGL